MTFYLVLIPILMALPPNSESEADSLTVIGIHRPLELSGRRIHIRRKVYLRPGEFQRVPKLKIGTTMAVHRPSRAVFRRNHQGSNPSNPFQGPDTSKAKEFSKDIVPSETPLDRNVHPNLSPAKALDATRDGRPPGFSHTDDGQVRRRGATKGSPADAPADPPITDKNEEVRIGTIQIEAIQGTTFIGRIVEDGLSSGKGASNLFDDGHSPVVMAGDIARILSVPAPPVKKRPTMSKKFRKDLAKERDRLVRDLSNRGRKAKPFRRRVMKWDL